MTSFLKNKIRFFLRSAFGLDVISAPKCLPPRVGENCLIDSTVQFEGHIENIEIGKNVRIERNVTIQCTDQNSKICIGDNTVIMPNVIIQSNRGGWLEIGSNCSLNPFCSIYGGYGGLKIGNYVRIATHCVLTPTNHNFDSKEIPITKQDYTSKGIAVEDDVWFGAGVIVLDGCTIGKGSVVGAGSLVNKSFGPYNVIAGVPARQIRERGVPRLEKNPS